MPAPPKARSLAHVDVSCAATTRVASCEGREAHEEEQGHQDSEEPNAHEDRPMAWMLTPATVVVTANARTAPTAIKNKLIPRAGMTDLLQTESKTSAEGLQDTFREAASGLQAHCKTIRMRGTQRSGYEAEAVARRARNGSWNHGCHITSHVPAQRNPRPQGLTARRAVRRRRRRRATAGPPVHRQRWPGRRTHETEGRAALRQ